MTPVIACTIGSKAGKIAVGTGLAVAGAARIDNSWINPFEDFVTETHPVHGAGFVVRNDDISLAHQALENVFALVALKIQRGRSWRWK